WASAILDGADGILARAQNSFSPLGRALDGSADMIVGFGTVLPAFYHLWTLGMPLWQLGFAPVAIGSAILHIELYDYYKESYLQLTNPAWNGRPERVADAVARHAQARASGAPWIERAAADAYVALVTAQTRIVARTNPDGAREPYDFPVDARRA